MGGITAGRRRFLGGLLAAGLIPRPTWADAGSPAFLSAAANADGGYVLCGITRDLQVAFQRPLPARGHAAAAHPTRPEAVAFARRPGTFAVVIDCATGAQMAMLAAPPGRHFYGHGAFSADGSLLFTTENDFEAGQGRIGVWNAHRGYVRIDDWDSGGIGPHDIKRLPGTDTLVIANGGIDTHPDSGRTKLNIPTMRPNLTYISDGVVVETMALPADHHKNSIRHLAVSRDGAVAFGMQWEGDGPAPALVGRHRRGSPPTLMQAQPEQMRALEGYVGSIACSDDGLSVVASAPRGGVLHVYDAVSGGLVRTIRLEDVCGVSYALDGITATSGLGVLQTFRDGQEPALQTAPLAWDNHLVRL